MALPIRRGRRAKTSQKVPIARRSGTCCVPTSCFVASNKALQTLGDRIREARKSTGLSQEELALQADIDRSFMGQVERGQRNISVLTLLRVARVLDINLGSMLDGLGGVGVALAEGVTPYRAKKPRSKASKSKGRGGKGR